MRYTQSNSLIAGPIQRGYCKSIHCSLKDNEWIHKKEGPNHLSILESQLRSSYSGVTNYFTEMKMYYCGRNELLGIEQLIWDMHGLPVCSEIKFLSRISCCLRPSTSPRSSSSRRFILVILTSFPVFNFVDRSIFLSTYINSLLGSKPTNQNTRNIRQCKNLAGNSISYPIR